jgi:hypothetical protein
MKEPTEDQVSSPERGPKQSSFDSHFEKGWEELELLTAQEREAKAKEKSSEAEGEKSKEEKPKESSTPEKKPYKVLKVQGKDVPVYSEEELIKLAQQGADYTKKTQMLADDRRNAEKEIQEKVSQIEAQSSKMNELLQKMIDSGLIKEPQNANEELAAKAEIASGPADKKSIYEQFDIDPTYAQPHEKKMVEAIASMRKDMEEMRVMFNEAKAEQIRNLMDKAINEEREKYPFDEIKNDQGENLTALQFRAIVQAKKEQLLGESRRELTVEEAIQITKDAVREVHLLQKKSKENAAPDISDDMPEDEFLEKYPNLAKRLKEKLGTQAVAENEAKKSKVPPSLSPLSRGSETKPPKGSTEKRKSFEEYLDAGFEDPETIKAIHGG